jgi:hypothetical protein
VDRTIELIISPTGDVVVQTRGFANSSCREAGKFIEQALGNQIGEQLTSEFYQAAESRHTQRHARGG